MTAIASACLSPTLRQSPASRARVHVRVVGPQAVAPKNGEPGAAKGRTFVRLADRRPGPAGGVQVETLLAPQVRAPQAGERDPRRLDQPEQLRVTDAARRLVADLLGAGLAVVALLFLAIYA